MIVIPAIDLRQGACVQLVGGDYAQERVRIPDVIGQARLFASQGFRVLHVVDLDAATERGENSDVVARLVRESGLEVQVGGGVRSVERAAALVEMGAARVVVGTRAIEDVAFREEIVRRFEDRIVIAVDVRDTEVLVRGWQGSSGRTVFDLAAELEGMPLAGLLVTAVHREGRLAGVDGALYAALGRATRHPIIASGGVTTLDDLSELRDAGCYAAVIGMALYTGALDGASVARFGEEAS